MKKILFSNRIGMTLMLVALLFSAMVCNAQETYLVNECQPGPCVEIQAAKTKMPVPCNCFPKVSNLADNKISIKTADPKKTMAKIVNGAGQVYASTSKKPGGVSFDRASGMATLSFGVVNKKLAGQDLKLIISTIALDAKGNKVPKETVVNIGN
jgi:hypothetical protein